MMDGWIALKDNLPDLRTPVLITDGKVCVVAQWHGFDRLDPALICWQEVGFGGFEWEWDFADRDITHWMPLPPLPTEEGL